MSSPVLHSQALNEDQKVHGFFRGHIVDAKNIRHFVQGTARVEQFADGLVHVTLPLVVGDTKCSLTFEIESKPEHMLSVVERRSPKDTPRQRSLPIVYAPTPLMGARAHWHAYLCHLDQTVRITERDSTPCKILTREDRPDGTFLQYAMPIYLYEELAEKARKRIMPSWHSSFAIMGDRDMSPKTYFRPPSPPLKLMSAGIKSKSNQDKEIDDALRDSMQF